MGLSIHCKKTSRSIDLGYGGFLRLRRKVAELSGIGDHYRVICEPDSHFMVFATKDEKSAFWESYDAKTEQLIRDKVVDIKVADFLYQTDCGGRIRYGACKNLLKVIGDYDDNILYGYAGRPDCARFKDFKAILEDCVRTKSDMIWN